MIYLWPVGLRETKFSTDVTGPYYRKNYRAPIERTPGDFSFVARTVLASMADGFLDIDRALVGIS